MFNSFLFVSGDTERAVESSVRLGFSRYIATGPNYDLCTTKSDTIPNFTTVFSCEPPHQASFVSFHISSNESINLRFHEIEVHGVC